MVIRPFGLMYLVTRANGTAEYGVLTQVFLSSAFLVPIITFRMSSVLTRFVAGQNDDSKIVRSVNLALLVTISTAGLMMVFGSLGKAQAARFVFGNEEYAAMVIPMMAYVSSRAAFEIACTYFFIVQKQKIYGIMQTVWGLGEMVIIGFVCRGLPLGRAIEFSSLWALVLAGVLILRMFVKHGAWTPGWEFPSGTVRFIGWLLLSHVVFFWSGIGNRYALAGVSGMEMVGLYAAAWTIAQGVSLITQPNVTALLPAISSSWNGDDLDAAGSYVRLAYKILFYVGLPVVVGLSIYGTTAIELVTSRACEVPAIVISTLAFACLVQGVYQITVYSSWMRGEFASAVLIQALGVCINLGGTFLLVRTLGLLGAAVGVLGAATVMAACMYWRSLSIYRTGIDWVYVMRCSVSAGIMWLVVLLFRGVTGSHGLLALSGGAVLGAATYLASSSIFGVIPPSVSSRLRSAARWFPAFTK